MLVWGNMNKKQNKKKTEKQNKFLQASPIEIIKEDIQLTSQHRRPAGNLYRFLDKSVNLLISQYTTVGL